MAVVLDTNMKLFADRMNITSSRMVGDYGLKTVEEIIEAEAEKGNMRAVKYAAEVFHSPQKLIDVFRLSDVENKFVILQKMDDETRREVLPLLDPQDLVMGLFFFTQDKLLEMLLEVDIAELVNVVLTAFPIENIMDMYTEDDLAMFFQNDNLEREDVLKQLKLLPPEFMQKLVEGVTGMPYNQENADGLMKSIENMPVDKYKDFMSSIDPEVQRQLVFQLTKEKPEYLQLFPNQTYVNMLSTMQKPDMVKSLIALNKETLVGMNSILPPDLMSIVTAQVDTKEFAKFLIHGHLDILKEAMMI